MVASLSLPPLVSPSSPLTPISSPFSISSIPIPCPPQVPSELIQAKTFAYLIYVPTVLMCVLLCRVGFVTSSEVSAWVGSMTSVNSGGT